MNSGDLIQKLGTIGKGGLLSVAMAGAGFLFHVAVASDKQETKLEQHDAQIQRLVEGQVAAHKDLNDVAVTIARVEGKLDVLNQKIDDDRSSANSRHK